MSMTDRELLELAAKAAGLEVSVCQPSLGVPLVVRSDPALGGWFNWNPLSEDGDALRLAVKLRIQVTPRTYGRDEFTAFNPEMTGTYAEYLHFQQDEYAATRRAIVRAAAAMAKES